MARNVHQQHSQFTGTRHGPFTVAKDGARPGMMGGVTAAKREGAFCDAHPRGRRPAPGSRSCGAGSTAFSGLTVDGGYFRYICD
eukprot:7314112-Prymnesium_polylepis.1